MYVYVDDDAFRAVYSHADAALRDAMDLAYLTGQRVADVWSMDVRQVTARGLIIQQSKTSNRVTMEITGELAALLERIAKRKGEKCPNGREKVYSTRLIVDDDGLRPCATGSTRPGRQRVLQRGSSSSAISAPRRVRTRPIRQRTFARRRHSSGILRSQRPRSTCARRGGEGDAHEVIKHHQALT